MQYNRDILIKLRSGVILPHLPNSLPGLELQVDIFPIDTYSFISSPSPLGSQRRKGRWVTHLSGSMSTRYLKGHLVSNDTISEDSQIGIIIRMQRDQPRVGEIECIGTHQHSNWMPFFMNSWILVNFEQNQFMSLQLPILPLNTINGCHVTSESVSKTGGNKGFLRFQPVDGPREVAKKQQARNEHFPVSQSRISGDNPQDKVIRNLIVPSPHRPSKTRESLKLLTISEERSTKQYQRSTVRRGPKIDKRSRKRNLATLKRNLLVNIYPLLRMHFKDAGEDSKAIFQRHISGCHSGIRTPYVNFASLKALCKQLPMECASFFGSRLEDLLECSSIQDKATSKELYEQLYQRVKSEETKCPALSSPLQ